MKQTTKRALLLIASILLTFIFLRVSFWGGVIVIGLTVLYILGVWLFTRRCQA
jgi:lipopolysaccharide export LptBFGC system permease protein LptF